MRDLTEKGISSRQVFDGHLLKVYVDRVILPNGEESGREYILTLTDKGRRIYTAYSEAVHRTLFQPIFRELDQLSPDQLEAVLKIYHIIDRQED